jgi:hypothetical protein
LGKREMDKLLAEVAEPAAGRAAAPAPR